MNFRDELSESDDAKSIRELIKKKLGLSSRDVSVKTKQGGYSSAVNVAIKTKKALALMKEIEAIGNSKESIDRDVRSGEILAGGNTFVFTDIDYKFSIKIENEIQAEYKKQKDVNGDALLFNTFKVGSAQGHNYVSLNKGGRPVEIRNLDYVGSAVMSLIRSSNDDTLYSKIK